MLMRIIIILSPNLSTKPRQAKLEALLSDRKIELADIHLVKTYVNDLRKLLDESSLCERRAFIRSFIKEIIVAGDTVQLNYDLPLSQESLACEEIGVLPIVHNGGR
jgi:site-specific DNA recombinase